MSGLKWGLIAALEDMIAALEELIAALENGLIEALERGFNCAVSFLARIQKSDSLVASFVPNGSSHWQAARKFQASHHPLH